MATTPDLTEYGSERTVNAMTMMSAVPVRSRGRWLKASAKPSPMTVPGMASGRLARSRARRAGECGARDVIGDQRADRPRRRRGHDRQRDRVDQRRRELVSAAAKCRRSACC
jgi:hypothetical protein